MVRSKRQPRNREQEQRDAAIRQVRYAYRRLNGSEPQAPEYYPTIMDGRPAADVARMYREHART